MNPEEAYLLLASADFGEGFTVLLYKTAGGKYFACERTTWGKTERIMTLQKSQAMKTYREFPIHHTEFEVAFPEAELEQTTG